MVGTSNQSVPEMAIDLVIKRWQAGKHSVELLMGNLFLQGTVNCHDYWRVTQVD